MVDVVVSIAAKVAELLVVPIGKHLCYPFKYKSNINELKKQIKKLRNESEMVQNSVDEAVRQGDEIVKAVHEWLKSVDEFAEKVAKPIIDDEDKAKKLCSIGFCSNLMTRYTLSKKAAKTAKDGVNLLGEGAFQKFSYRPPLRKTKSIYIRGYEDFDSRLPVFEKIMETLKVGDGNLIGVYGMGGVGKTTLVKRVAAQAIEDKLFDVVVMAEVTQTPDLKTIQEEIADSLGLKFHEVSVSGRAARLRDRLKKEKRVLVILDNIWEKLDLEVLGIPLEGDEKGSAQQKEDWKQRNNDLSVAIPLGGDENGSAQQKEDCEGRNDDLRQYKILLTSRYLNVLCNDMNVQNNFYVQTLSYNEAWNMFVKVVGDLAKNPDFNCIAVEVVKKCAGLPVAIATIANALKNKSDLAHWKDALRQLLRPIPGDIEGMDANVYSAIKLSYNFLGNEEAKLIFLLCGLENAGHNISIEDLVRYCMGLCLFNDVDTLEEGRAKLHKLIGFLKGSCLLLDGHTKTSIKMHDIVHTVSGLIARSHSDKPMFNIQNVTRLKEELEKKIYKESTAISLPEKDVNYELPLRLEFPKLQLFSLSKKDLSLQIPDTFFEGTEELKVLDLTKINLLSFPSSLGRLTKLQTLCLKECLLGDAVIIRKLKNLEILSFRNSDIKELPGEIKQLTRLRLLDLSSCSKLKVIKPNVISCLTRLEELYMGDSFVQWEVEGQSNASLSELKQLSHLTILDMHVADAGIMPQDLLIFEKLERYRIFIGDVWDWSGNYVSSRTFKLKLNNSIFLGHGVKMLLNRTEALYLDEMKGFENVLYQLNAKGFPQLKHLHVQNCLEIQYIVNSIGWGQCNVFPRLESLFLHNLINLEKICHGQISAESFSKLRIIKVGKCDQLKNLFSLFMAKKLSQIQEIEVTDCEKLEEIVSKEVEDQVQEHGRCEIEFTELCTLTLQRLPRLTSFSINLITPDMRFQEIHAEDEPDTYMPLFKQNVVLPNLKNLKLSSIMIECSWLDQLPMISSCFRALTNLTLEKCIGLKFLFSCSMVKSLVELQKLEVRNCNSIEGIINTEEFRGEEIKMEFPKLLILQLKGLPEVTRFSSGNSVVFHSLTRLFIEDCPKFETFLSDYLSGDITQSKDTEETNYPALFDKKVAFPCLKELILRDLPELLHLWKEDSQPSMVFENLTSLEVSVCGKLKTLVPSSVSLKTLMTVTIWRCNGLMNLVTLSTAKTLVQLVRMNIFDCIRMQKIITDMGDEEIITGKGEKDAAIDKLIFPMLNSIKLWDLPNLTSFYSGSVTLECPSLTTISIANSPKMETFVSPIAKDFSIQSATPFSEKAVRNKQPLAMSCFQNITVLIMHGCDALKYLFPSSIVESLAQLNVLEISECKFMKEVIVIEEEKISTTLLPNLNRLKLKDLPELTIFCNFPGNLIELQSLSHLWIANCPNMDAFICNLTSADMSASKELLEEMKSEESVHTNRQPFFDEKVNLPCLKTLKIEHMGNLRNIWHDQPNLNSFCLLESLIVLNCSNLLIVCPSNILGRLQKLEVLVISMCGSVEEVFEFQALSGRKTDAITANKLRKLELSYLPKLKHVWKMGTQGLLAFKNLRLISVYHCRGLKSLIPASIARELGELQELKINNCRVEEVIGKEEEQVAAVPKFEFPKLTLMELGDLPKLKGFYPGLYTSEWKMLKTLKVWGCNKVEVLASELQTDGESEHGISIRQPLFLVDEVAFPSLEELVLDWNCIVKETLHGKFSDYSSKLKSIMFVNNFQRSTICPSYFLYTLPNLEKFEVYDQSFRNIFSWQQIDCKEKHAGTPSKLSYLKLYKVFGWYSPWEKNSEWSTALQNLATLEVLECLKLRNLELFSASFQNLTTLEVSRCHGIHNLVAVSTAKDLVQLTRMSITDCQMIEEVIAHMEDEMEDRIIFKQLKYLGLQCLPSLRSFYSGNCTIEFPSLQQVVLRQCPNMNIFSWGVLNTPKLQRLQMIEAENGGYWEGNLNATTQKLFKDMAGFRGLQHLTLSKFPHLKDVWHNQLPVSFFCNLKSLVVDGCTNISSAIPGNLLQCLNSLKTLDIRNCESLEEVFDLEELNADGNFKVLSQLSKFYLVNLSTLRHIWTKTRPQIFSFRTLTLMEVDNCSSLRYVFTPSVVLGLVQLQKLEIKNCAMMEEIIRMEGENDAAIDKITLFPKLNQLKLKDLPELTIVCNFNENLIEFSSLSILWIENCPKMETFVCYPLCTYMTVGKEREEMNLHSDGRPFFDEKVAFPCLKELKLCQLPDMLHLCKEDSQPGILSENLTSLQVYGCENLKTLVPPSVSLHKLMTLTVDKCNGLINLMTLPTAKTLVQLETMNISHCKMMEKVIIDMMGDEEIMTAEGDKDATIDKITFSMLESIELRGLPNLTSFYSGSNTLDCPSLTDIGIKDCPKMEAFVFPNTKDLCFDSVSLFNEKVVLPVLKSLDLSDIGIQTKCHNQLLPAMSCFQNLTQLIMCGCDNLKYLFPSSTAESLVHLEILKVSNCKFMEGVIINQVEIKSNTLFPKLNKLKLKDLPELTRYCDLNGDSIELPSLSKLAIKKCPKMQAFISDSVCADMPAIKKPEQVNTETEQILHSFFDEKVVLPVLEFLDLSDIGIQTKWHNQLLQAMSCFQNLTELIMCGCDNLKYLFPSSIAEDLVHLEILEISNCKFMEGVIITQVDIKSSTLFPKLNRLKLKDLPKLTRFYNFNRDSIELPSLLELVIKKCAKMKTFISDSAIKESEEVNTKTDENLDSLFDEKVAFPCLRNLKLHELPELLHLWKEDSQPGIIFENLKNLDVSSCEKLKTLLPFSVSLEKLMTLTVQSCNGLMNLMTPSSAKTLLQLKTVNIQFCRMLEEIIIDVGDEEIRTAEGEKDAAIDKITFSMLQSITLGNLPNLISFYSGSNTLECPSLTYIEIKDCPKMETFVFPNTNEDLSIPSASLFNEKVALPVLSCLHLSSIGIQTVWHKKLLEMFSVAESLAQLKFLEISDCKFMKGIIVTEEQISTTLFHKLMHLKLKNLPELTIVCNFIENVIELPSLYKLWIENCPKIETFVSNRHLCTDVRPFFDEKAKSSCLQNLTELIIGGPCIDNLKYLFPTSMAESFVHLKVLKISSCKFMERVIITQEERKSSTLFPKLKRLNLEDLPELTRFCSFNGNSIELLSLSELGIKNCRKMQTFVSDSLFADMPVIKELEEVYTEENLHSFFDEKVALPCMHTLEFSELPQLLQLWKENSQPSKVFEKLAYLRVAGCCNLKTLFPSWVSLQNLVTLEVQKCGRLINVVTFSTAKSLEQLKIMKIIDCQTLEEIIIDLGDEVKDGIVFNQLKYMELSCLPNLASFCKGNFTIKFPSLERVLVMECFKMMNFSQGVLSTPKLKRLRLKEEDEGCSESEEDEAFSESDKEEDYSEREDDEWCWEGDLNTTIQKLFNDMNAESSEQK